MQDVALEKGKPLALLIENFGFAVQGCERSKLDIFECKDIAKIFPVMRMIFTCSFLNYVRRITWLS